MYKKYFKRLLDFTLSFFALVVLSPLFLVLIILGFFYMHGNPFFTQERPGKNEIIFKMLKFRSMNNKRDSSGKLLSDDERMNSYGKFIRGTSLDELPELINILKGDMSIVGPRPLRVYYLPWYTETEKHRHDVRPGLTGLAQINGRNNLDWDSRLALDVEYVLNISFAFDIKIILKTIAYVIKRKDVNVDNFEEGRLDEIRKLKLKVKTK